MAEDRVETTERGVASGRGCIEAAAQTLLIVDDDCEIRVLLAEQLGAYGYRVVEAEDGDGMHHALSKCAIDLIVLDLNLPRKDGLILCRELRTKSPSPPIIMLTARDTPMDRVVGLELGADDYVAKPFEPRELVARIRNVLRRSPIPSEPESPKMAYFGEWTLNLVHRRLESEGGPLIILSGAEFRLMWALVQNAGRVLSREELRLFVSAPGEDTLDRAIDLQISRLRLKLGKAVGQLVRTVRSEGYVFAAQVTLE